jgi:hypothetical protein
MRFAVDGSRRIVETFLDCPGVHVSSRDRFEELLSQWKNDPCLQREREKSGQT